MQEWKGLIATEHPHHVCVMIKLNQPHTIISSVASILRGYFPEKVIVTWTDDGHKALFELRTGHETRLNLASILKAVERRVQVINSGGHPSAAGAAVHHRDVPAFVSALHDQLGGSTGGKGALFARDHTP